MRVHLLHTQLLSRSHSARVPYEYQNLRRGEGSRRGLEVGFSLGLGLRGELGCKGLG